MRRPVCSGEYLGRDLKQWSSSRTRAAPRRVGAEAVAHGDADGTPLLFTTSSVIELNPVLYKKLSYDPRPRASDLGILTEVPMIMIVSPLVPAKTIAEFIDYARRIPGKGSISVARQRQYRPARGRMSKQQQAST